MSWPAQKAGPLAPITRTRTAGSAAIAAISASSAVIMALESALRAAGRLRISVAIPSASLLRMDASVAASVAVWVARVAAMGPASLPFVVTVQSGPPCCAAQVRRGRIHGDHT